jgi:hypothetical protein
MRHFSVIIEKPNHTGYFEGHTVKHDDGYSLVCTSLVGSGMCDFVGLSKSSLLGLKSIIHKQASKRKTWKTTYSNYPCKKQ